MSTASNNYSKSRIVLFREPKIKITSFHIEKMWLKNDSNLEQISVQFLKRCRRASVVQNPLPFLRGGSDFLKMSLRGGSETLVFEEGYSKGGSKIKGGSDPSPNCGQRM